MDNAYIAAFLIIDFSFFDLFFDQVFDLAVHARELRVCRRTRFRQIDIIDGLQGCAWPTCHHRKTRAEHKRFNDVMGNIKYCLPGFLPDPPQFDLQMLFGDGIERGKRLVRQ